MRKLLFRALFKHRQNGETLWQFTAPNHKVSKDLEKIYSQETPWLQFTGLTDKQGIEIFEGDIIETRLAFNIQMRKGIIKFQNGFFIVAWGKSEEPFNDILEIHGPNSVVIGNVYEHPELLEGK